MNESEKIKTKIDWLIAEYDETRDPKFLEKIRELQEEEKRQITGYNNELWLRFISIAENSFKTTTMSPNKLTELKQSLDLIRAISSFRMYKSPEELFLVYPDLESQSHSIELLWDHFSRLSQEELADLMISMILEIGETFE